MLEHFILHWGYLGIGVGTFFEGEAFLIAGGALSHRHLLSFPLVLTVAILGNIAGTEALFFAGRRWGRRYIAKRPHWAERAGKVDGWIARWGNLFVFSFRFLVGLRIIVPITLGASRYSATRFAVLNVAGALVWGPAIGFAGWALGEGIHRVMARAGRVEEIILGVIALAVAIYLVRRHFVKRADKLGDGPTTADGAAPKLAA